MKLAAYCTVFRDAEFLKASIDSVIPFVDRYLILFADRPFDGKPRDEWPADNTGEILDAMLASGDYPKLTVKRGFWSGETSTRNYALDYIRRSWPDITHAWLNDADEGFTRKDAENLVAFVDKYSSTHTIFYTKCRTYWKSFDWWINPIEPRCPLVIHDIVKVTQDGNFVGAYYDQLRNISMGAKIVVPETIAVQQHFSYVRASDQRIKEKISTFEHRGEIVPGWFENVWLAWNPAMTNIHPTAPNCYRIAEGSDPDSIPESFRHLTAFTRRGHGQEVEVST